MRISVQNQLCYIPKGVIIFKGIFGYVWKFLNIFLHIRTFLFVTDSDDVDQLNDLQFVLNPNKIIEPVLLQYKRKTSRPN
jgi:hypothetical protein